MRFFQLSQLCSNISSHLNVKTIVLPAISSNKTGSVFIKFTSLGNKHIQYGSPMCVYFKDSYNKFP